MSWAYTWKLPRTFHHGVSLVDTFKTRVILSLIYFPPSLPPSLLLVLSHLLAIIQTLYESHLRTLERRWDKKIGAWDTSEGTHHINPWGLYLDCNIREKEMSILFISMLDLV